jgi:hypothetical protein
MFCVSGGSMLRPGWVRWWGCEFWDFLGSAIPLALA